MIYFALQYPSGELVGLDTSSGGYPYKTEIHRGAWLEKQPNELIDYMNKSSEDFKLVKVEITITQ